MKVLLGVTGGIAAYKSAELVRALQQRGILVQVVMTRSARRFIQPLTFAALTGYPVLTSLWSSQLSTPNSELEDQSSSIEHIAVAQSIDALVIAPCTANTLARLAHGLADDLLSTIYLATHAPVVIAPAMNVNMWHHPATQANLRILEARGAQIVPSGSGYLACGMTGGGRLAEIETIAEAVLRTLSSSPGTLSSFAAGGGYAFPANDLAAETILITAGGTREPIDPVRFLGNRSSGRMGHALAEEAVSRGARVILITASFLPAPAGCETIRVGTAAEMRSAVLDRLPAATLVIKAAAVADFRLAKVAGAKIRRNGPLTLALEPTEDILAETVRRRTPGALVIGFAAETEDVLPSGRAKLLRKGVDALVLNDVSSAETGFDSEENAGWFLTPDSTVELPRSSKRLMARRILSLALHLPRIAAGESCPQAV